MIDQRHRVAADFEAADVERLIAEANGRIAALEAEVKRLRELSGQD